MNQNSCVNCSFSNAKMHVRKIIKWMILSIASFVLFTVFIVLAATHDFEYYFALPAFLLAFSTFIISIFFITTISDYYKYLYDEIKKALKEHYTMDQTQTDAVLRIKIEDIVSEIFVSEQFRPHKLSAAKSYLERMNCEEFAIKVCKEYLEIKCDENTFLSYAKSYKKEIQKERVEEYFASIKATCTSLVSDVNDANQLINDALYKLTTFVDNEKERVLKEKEKIKADKERREFERLNKQIAFIYQIFEKEREDSKPRYYSRRDLYSNFCWNCGSSIDSTVCKQCSKCGYYHCTKCGECMCNYPGFNKKNN